MKIITVPWLPYNIDGLALRWVILIKKGHYSIDLIDHELIHIEQQKDRGFFKYCYHYATDPVFRYCMELEAYEKGSKLSLRQAIQMAERYGHI